MKKTLAILLALTMLLPAFASDPRAWAEAQRAAVVALRAALPRA